MCYFLSVWKEAPIETVFAKICLGMCAKFQSEDLWAYILRMHGEIFYFPVVL